MITTDAGNEGFRWFIGVVEDRDDPEKLGRVRVRIYNLHSESKALIPTNTLPWATLLMPPNNAGLNQVGLSPTGILVGSTVFGFFLDGNEATLPVIFGTFYGIGDPPKLSQGQNTVNKNPIGPEPPSAYNATFPFNKVMQTERGHVIEIDDTPNFERLHAFHRSGTYVEINQNGDRVDKVVGESFEIDLKNKTLHIQKNMNVVVKGNYSLKVDGVLSLDGKQVIIKSSDGILSLDGKQVIINNGTKGAARKGDAADTADPGGLEGTNQIDAGSETVFIGD